MVLWMAGPSAPERKLKGTPRRLSLEPGLGLSVAETSAHFSRRSVPVLARQTITTRTF